MRDEYIDEMISSTLPVSTRKLKTPKDVDNVFRDQKGITLVFVNSACGCASRIARPAFEVALQHSKKSDTITTIFATTDVEATAHARKYFRNQPPSSPSFAILRDGKFLDIIHRSAIKSNTPMGVARLLIDMFDKYCTSDQAVSQTRTV